MNDTITVTREQLEREMLGCLDQAHLIRNYPDKDLDKDSHWREELAKSFTDTVFHNAQAREEAALCSCEKALGLGSKVMCDTCFYTETDVDKALCGAKRHHSANCTNCNPAFQADSHRGEN